MRIAYLGYRGDIWTTRPSRIQTLPIQSSQTMLEVQLGKESRTCAYSQHPQFQPGCSVLQALTGTLKSSVDERTKAATVVWLSIHSSVAEHIGRRLQCLWF
ncbi:hypothetical protein AWENTII_013020 [Aspergillus wentii]